MKKILLSMAFILCASQAFAAGSWVNNGYDKGPLGDGPGGVIGFPRTATTDGTGAIDDLPINTSDQLTNVSGCMTGYLIVFDGSLPPTSVVASIKDKYGLVINPDTDDTVEAASVRVSFDQPVCIAGGLSVDFTVVGNSKIFKFVPLFLR